MENTILSLWRQRVQAQISIAEPTRQRTTPPLLHLLSPGLWTHPQTAQPWHPCSPVKLMQLTRLTFSLSSLLWKNYTGFLNTILWSFSRNRQWNGVSQEGRILLSSITAEIFKHLVLEPQRCLTDSPHSCWRVELLVSCIYMWQNVLFSSHTVHSLGLTLHMCRLLIYRYSLSHSEQFRQRQKWICCRRVSTCTWQPVLATYPKSCWSARYSARFWEGRAGGGIVSACGCCCNLINFVVSLKIRRYKIRSDCLFLLVTQDRG